MKDRRLQKSKSKEMGRGETLLDMIQKNRMLMEHIEQVYEFDQARISVLQHIFIEMGKSQKEEIKSEIFRYGSLIKRDDLLARQLFIWLLGAAEGIRA